MNFFHDCHGGKPLTGRNNRHSSGESWEEIVSIIQIALVFFALLAGRELGKIYTNYNEVSRLSIIFDIKEEDLADYIREVLAGNEGFLEAGLAFTLPSSKSVEGPVTETPDYVRRWFISVTLSAIIVQQPKVSDIEVQLWVEDELILTEAFSFERDEVPYRNLLKRPITLEIEDIPRFRRIIEEASERYGGEVEFKFTGQALVHVQFLKAWLPFFTARYPMVRAPHLDYLSSGWADSNNRYLEEISTGSLTYISFRLSNPTRVHSIWENVTLTVYKTGLEEAYFTAVKEVGVAGGTDATYVFPFISDEVGVYKYALEAPGGFRLDVTETPELFVELTA